MNTAARATKTALSGKTKQKSANFVYGCGFGRTGSLFSKVFRESGVAECWKPHQILYFNGKDIRYIAAGFGFSVLASTKRVYGGGVDVFSNDPVNAARWTRGTCINTVGNREDAPASSSFGGSKITGLAAGRRHFLLATSNAVYAFGDNAHGQCGQPPEMAPFVRVDKLPYKKIDVPSNSPIAQVHCTLDTSFILLKSGEVFSFGLGTDGQLGRGICSYDWHCLPVEGDLKGVEVKCLKGSTDTLMAVSRTGELFMWGQNEYDQMHPFVNNIQSGVPHEIRLSMKQIIDANSTATSCIALTHDGEVYVWGFSILGFGPNVTSLRRPMQLDVNLFSSGPTDSGRVKSIAAGNTSMFAVSELNNLFSWGINRFAHLGLAHKKDQYFPFHIPSVKKTLDLSIAPDHALFLMR